MQKNVLGSYHLSLSTSNPPYSSNKNVVMQDTLLLLILSPCTAGGVDLTPGSGLACASGPAHHQSITPDRQGDLI